MSKTVYEKTKHIPRHVPRLGLIAFAVAFFVVGGSFSAYALYSHLATTVTISDPIVSQPAARHKATGTALSARTLPAATTPPLKSSPASVSHASPTSAPTTKVTPAPSSDVPSLTPTSTHSTTTTSAISYQSTNWAGYLASGDKYTSVSGSWTAPSTTGTSTTVESADGTWIGIGGVTSPDLIQVGTENIVSASGVVSTAGFYELLPAGAQSTPLLSVQSGDRISASITQTGVTQWTISMTNVTRGQTFTKSVTYTSSFSSAEWIQEDPSYQDGSLVLLDNFGTTQFSNAQTTANGTTLSASAIGASPITLVGSGSSSGHGAKPGSLSGGSFSVSYY